VSGSITVPSRFNGPQESGNGGYSAGALAALLEGPVEVNLRSPVPLDAPLEAVDAEGGALRILDGEAVILEGRSVPGFELEVPAPPSLEEARAAATRYRGLADGEFGKCFVCGLARPDAFAVNAGPVEGREMVASPWTPPEWAAGPDGLVRPEFVWSVLDCPTYFATHIEGEMSIAFLARLTGRVDALPEAGAEQVVVAWPIEIDGRKHHAGSAVFTAEGELLACARALMIEARSG
jgi:hypothetical protein